MLLRSKAKVRQGRWTKPWCGTMEGWRAHRVLPKIRMQHRKERVLGNTLLSYEERAWRARTMAEEKVLGLWIKKARHYTEMGERAAYSLWPRFTYSALYKDPLSFPYPEKDLTACRRAILTWPCLPWTAQAAAPLMKSHQEELCTVEEPRGRSQASAPFHSAMLNAPGESSATWEERKTDPVGERKRSEN